MTPFAATAISVLFFGLAGAADISPPMKCPPGTTVMFPEAPEVVWVLDGRTVASDSVGRLDQKQVAHLTVICATQLYRDFDIKARQSGVVVFSVAGIQPALNAGLESLGVLQRAHFAKHGVYAGELTDLAWSASPNVISIQLTISERGKRWTATATHRYVTTRSSTAAGSSGG